MRASRFSRIAFVSASLLAAPVSAYAQDAAAVQAIRSEIDQLKQDFDARLAALEARLAAVSGGQAAAPAPTPQPSTPPAAGVPSGTAGAGGPEGALPVYGGASAGSKIFNPDIAVIGNFIGA